MDTAFLLAVGTSGDWQRYEVATGQIARCREASPRDRIVSRDRQEVVPDAWLDAY